VYDLSRHSGIVGLAVDDKYDARIEAFKSLAVCDIESIKMDVSKYDALVGILKDYDLVVSALPGRYGFRVVKAVVKAVVDIVDVSRDKC